MPDQNDTYGNDKTDDDNARRQDDQSYGDELTTNDAAENLAIDQTGFELVVLTDRYEIEGELGQGGMGKVLLARDKRLPRQVAIKSLLPELAKSSIGTERFLREAQSAATLNHPNIVQIYDLGMTAQGPFFVMEYVQGGSLLDRLNKGPVEVDQAVDIICQLCNAVATAHDAGIIHRDIKPANILIDKSGHIWLTDFGVAYLSDSELTRTGAIISISETNCSSVPAYRPAETIVECVSCHSAALTRCTGVFAAPASGEKGAVVFQPASSATTSNTKPKTGSKKASIAVRKERTTHRAVAP